jgi:hypothetical protein
VAKHTPTWYLIYEQLEILFPDMDRATRINVTDRLERALLTKEAG